MSAPLTRQDVELRVGNLFAELGLLAPQWVTAALLAMAECEHCEEARGVEYQPEDGEVCPYCEDTGLDQARLAKGLGALRGERM